KFLLMLFAIIGVAISYYLLGFTGETKYGLHSSAGGTVRSSAIQYLEQANVPEEVVKSLRRLEDQKPVESYEEFKAKLQAQLTPEQWNEKLGNTTVGKTILKYAAPTPIHPFLKVLLVLLFAVVGMGGSYAVAWYGIRVNT